jgi:hypothetical protein
MLLDLSHGVRLQGITYPTAVNNATKNLTAVAPSESMAELLGNVLPRLLYTVATAPDAEGPTAIGT